MYKMNTSNDTKNNKQIKPRRIMLGGVLHSINDLSTLNKLRNETKEKYEKEKRQKGYL